MARRHECYGTDYAPFRDDKPAPPRAAWLDDRRLLPKKSVATLVREAARRAT